MNTVDFHKTTTNELLAIRERVRNLIKHWGEDGRYQEAVLKSVIERFLPERYRVVSGFVVTQSDTVGAHNASNQIDIIVYDTDFPVLFKEGDFAIVTADSVGAIVEVKANLRNQGPEKVIRKANEIGQFVFNAKSDHSKQMFNGIFSYAGNEKLQLAKSNVIENSISKALDTTASDSNLEKFRVNHISFNKDNFYKYWHQSQSNEGGILYEIEDLSFSFFISNLVANLRGSSVSENSKLWFPVDKSIKSRQLS